MYKFFVEPEAVAGQTIRIEGKDWNHMKNVIRLKVGDEVKVGDGSGWEYLCVIEAYSEVDASLQITASYDNQTELPTYIHLYQGLPKKDKLEWIIQKSVELGVGGITPVSMKRSVVKLDQKAATKKVLRWQNIADAAAKQSKRGVQPEVCMPLGLKALKEELASYDMLIVPYENADGMGYTREVLSEVKNCDRIGVVIGPEGGFEPEEVELLKSIGAKVITLGKRILRTETAGLSVLSYLMIDMEEL